MTQRLTITQMARKVALRIGIRLTGSPIGSGDLQIQQLMEFFNEEVYELGTLYRWQTLTKEAHFVTSAQEDQGEFEGAIIPDASLFNFILSDTMWDRTTRQTVLGPKSELDYQAQKALGIVSGPFSEYRIRDNRLLMLPQPAAGHDIYFEYQTKRFVHKTSDDTYVAEFTDEADVPVLDCDIIMAGVRWRWKAAKGFQYAEEKRSWEKAAMNASGRDGGKRKLSLGGGNSIRTGRPIGDVISRPV